MILLDVRTRTRHGHFEVHPGGQDDWAAAKDHVAELPSCHYVKDGRRYEVSFTDYSIMMAALKRRGLDKLVRVTSDFSERYGKYKEWRDYFLALRTQTKTAFNVPTALPLYQHQRVGVQFLIKRRFAICADEMGVGKTPTGLAAAYHLIRDGQANRALIVCPASVKIQWAKQIEKFLPDATYTMIGADFVQKRDVSCVKAGGMITAVEGEERVQHRVPLGHRFNARKRPCRGCLFAPGCRARRGDGLKPGEIRAQQYQAETDFLIVNYELLRLDGAGQKTQESWTDQDGNEHKRKTGRRQESLLAKLGVQYDIVIADEAHRLRNVNTESFLGIWRVAQNSKYRWGLTGTPIQTRLEDAWGVMRFVNPAVFGTSRSRFLERYAKRDLFGKVLAYQKVEEAHDKLAPNMIRRRTDEVLDLPPYIYSNHYVPLSKGDRALYDAVKTQQVTTDHVVGKALRESLNYCEPITTILRCRQLAMSASLIDPERPFGGEKIDQMIDVLADIAPDHKILLFCEFREFLDRFVGELRGHRIGSVYLHGGVPAGKARNDLVEQFWRDDKCRVFATTTAGGEGLDLQCADVLVLANLTWNPQTVAQIKGRLRRIGQTKRVNVVSFISQDTVEERVLEDGRYRNAIADRMVDGGELPTEPPISLKELLALL